MDVLNGFGQYALEGWRNFILLEEKPKIEAGFSIWINALWMQISLLVFVLLIGFFKLYQQSKQLYNDIINPDKTERPNNKSQSRERLYIDGLHDLVSDYYRCKFLELSKVKG